MEIPPPRPKRKPNNPYPRKTGPGPKNHHGPKDNANSLQSGIQILDLERKPPVPETTSHEQKQENENVSPSQEASLSLSSENENSIPRSVVVAARSGGVFRAEVSSLDETNESSYITTVVDKASRKHQKSSVEHTSLYEFAEGQNSDSTRCVYNHNYPRHVPVQVVDGNQSVPWPPEMSLTIEKPEEVDNNLSVNNRIASSYQQTVPTFHPPPPVFTPFSDNQENYTSFLRASSTISSLIVSSLLQNPAAHAAASFAAKFWHPGNGYTEASASSSETPPSMAAIAAATVAAATAWWAAHGLLPVCTPFYPPFSFPADGNQATNQEREKAPEKTQSSSSEEEVEELNSTEPNPDDDNTTKPELEVPDSSKNNNVRKQVDRSSCGSNTTSSSEIETDALEKNINIKEKEASDAANLASCNDSFSRNRARSTINPNESWKEVSEEGRLAFQALFSRQVLPQSFSDRHNRVDEQGELDLNKMSYCPSQHFLRGEKNMEEGLLTIGLGSVKLNVHHTGFKPYKRCSMEAKDSTTIVGGSSSNHNDDKGAKRMRLEAEAST